MFELYNRFCKKSKEIRVIPNMINRPNRRQWFSYITGSVGPFTFQICIGVRNFTEISVAP